MVAPTWLFSPRGLFSQDEMTELEHLWEKGGNHPFLANVGIAM